QSADRGRRVPRARRPWRQRIDGRAPHPRHVLREEGGPSAAAEAGPQTEHEPVDGLSNAEKTNVFERRLYYHIDWALLTAILTLCTLGVVMIYSTTSDPTRGASRLHITQSYAIGLGLVAMIVTMTFDYRTFTDKSHLIYGGIIVLLLYVLFGG